MMKTFSVMKLKITIPSPTSDERAPVEQDIHDEIIGVTTKTTSEEADFSSAELSVCYKTTAKPQMFESMCEPTLHSRDKFKSKSTTQKRRRVSRKRRSMTVNLMIPLWTLRLTPKKLKTKYH